MTKTSLRLAAATMTAATMLLTPVAASAHPVGEQPMGSMSGHAAMAYHPPKSADTSVSGTHMPMSQLNMAEMSMTSATAMARKMRGHATMADAMRAHPELAKMS